MEMVGSLFQLSPMKQSFYAEASQGQSACSSKWSLGILF